MPEDRNCFESEVYQDQVNRFCVEDTPGQFSSKTSLSNLSIEDEPIPLANTNRISSPIKPLLINQEKFNTSNEVYSDPEDFENDDNLLESTVNIGMETVPKSNGLPHQTKPTSDIHEMLLESVILDGIQVMTKKESHSLTKNDQNMGLPDPVNTTSEYDQPQMIHNFFKLPVRPVVGPGELNHSISSEESCDSLDDNILLDQLVQNGIDKITNNHMDNLSSRRNVDRTKPKLSQDIFFEPKFQGSEVPCINPLVSQDFRLEPS